MQLIDAETANHLWAERFDKSVADLFGLQDEIVSRLACTLHSQLVLAEARRAERSLHPDAMDLIFQARACLYSGKNPAQLTRSRALYERALAIDHLSVAALVGMAGLELTMGAYLLADDPAACFSEAEKNVTKALSLAPDDAAAHCALGGVYVFTMRAAQGIAECEHALLLDRNLANARFQIALGKYFLGGSTETERDVLDAFRLSPRDTNACAWPHLLGLVKLQLGANVEGFGWLRRSIEANRNFAPAHFVLAGALALYGALDEARASAGAGLALQPCFTIRRLLLVRAFSENPT